MSDISVIQDGLIVYMPGMPSPQGYLCKQCVAPRHGVKLWKGGRSSLERKMICVVCLGNMFSTPLPEISPEGLVKRNGTQSPIIKGLVPAVPISVPVRGFWPYPQLPNGALEWWMSLPLR